MGLAYVYICIMNNESVDYVTKQNPESDETIEFTFDTGAVFKRLADDIYESPKAGIRETVANGVTAIIKSIKRNQISREEGILNIRVIEDSDTLIIQDNGIGIEEERLKKVLTEIGKSTSYSKGDEAGQFGMGFISVFKLVGMDGGVTIKTRSRETDEIRAGVITNEAFNRYESWESESIQYGTRLEIPVKNGITDMELDEWVKDVAQYARVNVAYERVDSDGHTIYDDEWTGETLEEQLDDKSVYYRIDNKHFEAILDDGGIHNDPETILLDVPVDRNSTKNYFFDSWYGSVHIRLKNENGVVINGEHEGKTVVDNREPREGEIHINNLDDVWTPRPIGNRGKLEENKAFWDKLKDMFKEKVELHKKEFYDISSVEELREHEDIKYIDEFAGELKNEYEGELYEVLDAMDNGLKNSSSKVSDITEDDYIGVRISYGKKKKAEREGASVYEVKHSKYYEPIIKITGCNLLRRIGEDTSDTGKYEFNPTKTDDKSHDVSIHTPDGYRRLKISEIENYYSSGDTKLVVFRDDKRGKISQNKDMIDEDTHTVRMDSDHWDKIKNIENVVPYQRYKFYHYNEFIETCEKSIPIEKFEKPDTMNLFIIYDFSSIPDDVTNEEIKDELTSEVTEDIDTIHLINKYDYPSKMKEYVDGIVTRKIGTDWYYNYRMNNLSEEKKSVVESTFSKAFHLTIGDVKEAFDIIENC